jgi:hypothetical protein
MAGGKASLSWKISDQSSNKFARSTFMHKGSCLCGAIKFEVAGSLSSVEGCHCSECRKWTGHFLASTDVPRASLKIHHPDRVSWFHSSEKARRGFCSSCGSPLFFDPLDTKKLDWIGISMGAFDQPTGASMALHIFVAEKGDYYEIIDNLPQNQH